MSGADRPRFDDPEHALWGDPGLQPQRTAQSWQRAAGVAAIGCLGVVVAGLRLDAAVLVAAGAALAVALAAAALVALPAGRPDRPRRHPVYPLLLAAVVFTVLLAGLAAGGAVLLLIDHLRA